VPTPDLPDGVRARPPTMADAQAVVDVLRADEAVGVGEAITALADVLGDWRRPSMDLAEDGVVVLLGEEVVGYAEQFEGRSYVGVHPSAHGRGIGTALAAWTEASARARRQPRVGQTIADAHGAAADLLRARGYEPRWDSWLFSIPLTGAGAGPPAAPALPPGCELRPLRRPEEDRVVHDLIETAFSDWPDRESGWAFEDWAAAYLDREGRDAELTLVVVEGEAVIGAALCVEEGDEGWVEQLAVAREHRGRGLGRALLEASFATFARRGRTSAGLSTDSRTGARTLYEHVGMHVTSTWTRWSLDLDH
jgi:mycothiol synthase